MDKLDIFMELALSKKSREGLTKDTVRFLDDLERIINKKGKQAGRAYAETFLKTHSKTYGGFRKQIEKGVEGQDFEGGLLGGLLGGSTYARLSKRIGGFWASVNAKALANPNLWAALSPLAVVAVYQEYKERIDEMIAENSKFVDSYDSMIGILASKGIRYDISEVQQAMAIVMESGVQTVQHVEHITDRALYYSKVLGTSASQSAQYFTDMAIKWASFSSATKKDFPMATKFIEKLAVSISNVAQATSVSVQTLMRMSEEIMDANVRLRWFGNTMADGLKNQSEATRQLIALAGALEINTVASQEFMGVYERLGDILSAESIAMRAHMAPVMGISDEQLRSMIASGDQALDVMLGYIKTIEKYALMGTEGLIKNSEAYRIKLMQNFEYIKESGLAANLTQKDFVMLLEKSAEGLAEEAKLMMKRTENERIAQKLHEQVMDDWGRVWSSVKRIGGTLLVLVGMPITKILLPFINVLVIGLEKVAGLLTVITQDVKEAGGEFRWWIPPLKMVANFFIAIVAGFAVWKSALLLTTQTLGKVKILAPMLTPLLKNMQNLKFLTLVKVGAWIGIAEAIKSVVKSLEMFNSVSDRTLTTLLYFGVGVIFFRKAIWKVIIGIRDLLKIFGKEGVALRRGLNKVFGKELAGLIVSIPMLIAQAVEKTKNIPILGWLMKSLFGGFTKGSFIGGFKLLLRRIPFIGAIVGVLFDWKEWYSEFEKGNYAEGIMKMLGSVIDGLLLGIPSMLGVNLGQILANLISDKAIIDEKTLSELGSSISKGVADAIVWTFTKLPVYIYKVLQGLDKAVITIVTGIILGIGQAVVRLISLMLFGKAKAIEDFTDKMTKSIGSFFSNISNMFTNSAKAVVGVFTTMGESIIMAFESVWKYIKNVWNSITLDNFPIIKELYDIYKWIVGSPNEKAKASKETATQPVQKEISITREIIQPVQKEIPITREIIQPVQKEIPITREIIQPVQVGSEVKSPIVSNPVMPLRLPENVNNNIVNLEVNETNNILKEIVRQLQLQTQKRGIRTIDANNFVGELSI